MSENFRSLRWKLCLWHTFNKCSVFPCHCPHLEIFFQEQSYLWLQLGRSLAPDNVCVISVIFLALSAVGNHVNCHFPWKMYQNTHWQPQSVLQSQPSVLQSRWSVQCSQQSQWSWQSFTPMRSIAELVKRCRCALVLLILLILVFFAKGATASKASCVDYLSCITS